MTVAGEYTNPYSLAMEPWLEQTTLGGLMDSKNTQDLQLMYSLIKEQQNLINNNNNNNKQNLYCSRGLTKYS